MDEISTVDDYKPLFTEGEEVHYDDAPAVVNRAKGKVVAVSAMVTYEYKVKWADGSEDWYNSRQLDK